MTQTCTSFWTGAQMIVADLRSHVFLCIGHGKGMSFLQNKSHIMCEPVLVVY